MTQAQTVTDTSLTLRRTLDAAPDRVFRAMTEPRRMEKWMAPSPDFQCRVPVADVRKGGKYRIEMDAPDGQRHIAEGIFQEVAPARRLVYTWRWVPEGGEGMAGEEGEGLVTVDLRDMGGKTEVTLTHARLAGKESVQDHLEGWQGCLARLQAAAA